jgi:hypothetical protein
MKRFTLLLALPFCGVAAGSVAVDSLVRQQTEIFSAASVRKDPAGMNALLDDDVLFSNGDGSVQRDPQRDKFDAISALLKQRTQAFIDAKQRGDTARMRRYLDHEILFIDANAVLSEWHSFLKIDALAPANNAVRQATLSDWVLRHTDDVAVASFTLETLHTKFLAVCTWVKRGAIWKLIGSQIIPLHQDPAAMALSSGEMNDYVGTYASGPGSSVAIFREGDTLAASNNGAKAVRLDAEAHDVLFVSGQPPGYPRPRLSFQRDRNGNIVGYVNRIPGLGNLLRFKKGAAAPEDSGGAEKPSISSTLTLRDFIVHSSSNVAVASFLHDKVTQYNGQVLRTTFRSTETWIRRGTEWKMIASQGREL